MAKADRDGGSHVNVLIVGGAGYVGSPLTYQMWRAGHSVTVLDLLLFGGESLLPLQGADRFRLVVGDLRSEELLDEVVPGHDAVVLLAAIVGEPASNRDPEGTVETNLHGAEKVLAAAQRHGVPRFVFTSTCSNYGISDADGPVTETAPLMPISPYSETKVAAEKIILDAATDSFHPTVLRLSTAFGVSPRMRFDLLVSDFTLAAVRDGKIVIYGEQFWRPFVHVQDIAAAIDLVLHSDPGKVSGDVFNVGANRNNMQKINLGKAVQAVLPRTELEFVERNEDPRSYRVDFSKVEAVLGYQARWSIDDGIRELAIALENSVFPDPAAARYHN
jgi:nucleoside-diphosphate-sugar epimerase